MSVRFRTITALLILTMVGCGKESPPTGPEGPGDPDDGPILVSGSIPTGGGTLIVDREDSDLNGLTITVPSGAYQQVSQWSVTELELEPSLPSGMFQVGPALKVHNGQGYSQEPFLITLPARVGPDTARAAFFYEPSSGTYELIPTVALTDSTIVVMTRHVSADQLLIPSGAAGLRSGGPPSFGEVVVVIVATPDLAIHERRDSGFRPGTDDWEFPNYGSLLEPEGFCTGSTLSALYYHYVLKSSRGPLNSRYDSIDGAWQDNPRGIKLASVLQATADFVAAANGTNAISNAAEAHGVSWVYAQAASLSMSIMLTGRPQQVVILQSGNGKGHALIAYATQWGLFFVADPNAPGVERLLEYENGDFKPFMSASNAGVPLVMYDEVLVVGVTALAPMTRFKADFKAFDDSTIGDAYFAPTKLEYLDPVDTVWSLVGDTVVTASDTLLFRTDCQTCRFRRPGGVSNPPTRSLTVLLSESGTWVAADSTDTARGAIFPTPTGRTSTALVKYDIGASDGVGFWKYHDFAWTVVNRVPFELVASAVSGGVGDEIDFSVAAGPLGTSLSEYHWDFGDGSTPSVTIGTPNTTHSFDHAGAFVIKLELHDHSGAVRGRDSVTVSIGPMAWRFDSVGVIVSGAAPAKSWEISGVGKMDAIVARITSVPSDGLLIPKVGESQGLQFIAAPPGTGTSMTSLPNLDYGGPFYAAGGSDWEVAEGNSWLKLGSMADGIIEGVGERTWRFDCVDLDPSIQASTTGGVMRGEMTAVFTMDGGGKRTYTWTFRAQPFALEQATLKAASPGPGLRRC